MKYFKLIFLLLLYPFISIHFLFAAMIWHKDFSASKISVDFSNNIYAITRNNRYDAYLTKLDQKGIVQWKCSFSSKNRMDDFDMDVDSEGNIYIAGIFDKDISFQSAEGQRQSIVLSDWNCGDIFIVKYSPAGQILWKKIAISYGSFNVSISLGSECFYVAGDYNTSILFYSFDTKDQFILNENLDGDKDLFFSKYQFNGDLKWAKSIQGNRFDTIKLFAIDKMNDFVLAAAYLGNTLIEIVDGSKFLKDEGVFIAKYRENSPMWIQDIKGDCNIYDMIQINNDIYVAGNFRRSIDFYSGEKKTTSLSALGQDFYICKYLSDEADLQWVRKGGGSNRDYMFNLTKQSNGNVLLAGYIDDTDIAFFDNNQSLPGAIGNFIAEYSSEGVMRTLWKSEDISSIVNDILIDKNGHLILSNWKGGLSKMNIQHVSIKDVLKILKFLSD